MFHKMASERCSSAATATPPIAHHSRKGIPLCGTEDHRHTVADELLRVRHGRRVRERAIDGCIHRRSPGAFGAMSWALRGSGSAYAGVAEARRHLIPEILSTRTLATRSVKRVVGPRFSIVVSRRAPREGGQAVGLE